MDPDCLVGRITLRANNTDRNTLLSVDATNQICQQGRPADSQRCPSHEQENKPIFH